MENEKIIRETNAEFLAGKIHWWDRVNEDSDLPSDEFKSEKTGARVPGMGRGLLEPLEVFIIIIITSAMYHDCQEQRVDAKSEKYFSKLREDRTSIPESYSSVDLGIVSPVKNQVAFYCPPRS